MKKIWEKPSIVEMSIPKLTLSGSVHVKENPGHDDANKRYGIPNYSG